MTIVRTDHKKSLRSFATRSVLEKTDRILGPDVSVTMDQSGSPHPAFTDGKTIYINGKMEPILSALHKGFTPKTVMLITALNYHELAHCMFTPRLKSELVNRVAAQGVFMAFNILEDQSAETLFVKRYEPARHYFTALVTNYILSQDRNVLARNYPLISGRLFVPQTFRDRFRNAYVAPNDIEDIDRLVAEYKTLRWPEDQDEMFRVIMEFDELINSAPPPDPGNHDQMVKGKPDRKERRELQDEEEFVNDDTKEKESTGSGADDEEVGEEEGDSKSAGSEAEEEEGESEGTEGEGEDADSEKLGGGSGGDADSNGDFESDAPVEDEGSPGGSATPRNDEPLDEALDSAVSQAEDLMEEAEEEVAEELEDRIDSIQQEERNYQVSDEEQPHTIMSPKSEHHSLVRQCVDEFSQAKVKELPGWHRQQRQGKLDPRRYAKALQGQETVYKRWYQGINDIVDFEVCFCLDQSGSMMGRIDRASVALWTLRRTFEEHDGVTTVLGFSEGVTLLSQRFSEAKQASIPMYGVIGSTFAADALREAQRILDSSMKAMTLCVVITDGGFNDYSSVDQVITRSKHPTAIVGLDLDVSRWEGTKNLLHQETITDPMELVGVVKNLALNLSEAHARKGM